MKLILASFLLLTACGAQISPERAAEKHKQDRANHDQYLQEKYEDEQYYDLQYYGLFGDTQEFYNEKGQLLDVN